MDSAVLVQTRLDSRVELARERRRLATCRMTGRTDAAIDCSRKRTSAVTCHPEQLIHDEPNVRGFRGQYTTQVRLTPCLARELLSPCRQGLIRLDGIGRLRPCRDKAVARQHDDVRVVRVRDGRDDV